MIGAPGGPGEPDEPKEAPDYVAWNRANWDDRARAHAASPDYDLARYRRDPHALSDVVTFDRPALGDLTGHRAVHLQCHIGTDTLSLARLGATVSGLDISGESLQVARELADECGARIDYVQAEVSRALDVLPTAAFDLVYTGIGALCWVPAVDAWADAVAGLLRPGGRLFLREIHPVLWSLADQRPDGLLVVDLPYFETPAPTTWDDPDTYVETDHQITATRTAEWNHGLGEIVGALLARGLRLTALVEHRSVPFRAFPDAMAAHPDRPGEWVLRDRPERLALSYTLQAVREG